MSSEVVLDQEKLDNILSELPFTLNEKQMKFIVGFITIGGNWCLSGLAGSGKSCILLILNRYYEDEIMFCASSGVASINMPDNMSSGTGHSCLSLPRGIATEYDYRKVGSKCSNLLASSDKIKIICVDEGFSYNSDTLDVIYRRIQRFNKKTKNRGKRNIRLLLSGDAGQMTPIVNDKDQLELENRWGHHLMFMTDVWERFNFNYGVLSTVERQNDKVFKECLNVIRNYEVERFPKCLSWLNNNYNPNYPKDQLVLAATNKTVDKINNEFLKANNNPKYTFSGEKSGTFDMKDLLVKDTFVACVGRKIMTVVNDSPENGSRFVNGSLGHITSVNHPLGITVLFDNGNEEFIEPYCWENKERYIEKDVVQVDGSIKDEMRENLLGTYKTLPCTAGNSFSIIKSQGLSISSPFVIDLESTWLYTNPHMGSFGQNFCYIACSRGVSKDLITFATKVQPEHIKPCGYSMSFCDFCEEASII